MSFAYILPKCIYMIVEQWYWTMILIRQRNIHDCHVRLSLLTTDDACEARCQRTCQNRGISNTSRIAMLYCMVTSAFNQTHWCFARGMSILFLFWRTPNWYRLASSMFYHCSSTLCTYIKTLCSSWEYHASIAPSHNSTVRPNLLWPSCATCGAHPAPGQWSKTCLETCSCGSAWAGADGTLTSCDSYSGAITSSWRRSASFNQYQNLYKSCMISIPIIEMNSFACISKAIISWSKVNMC